MQGVCRVIDLEFGSAADTDFAHLACHEGCVGRDTSSCGENTFSRQHAPNILWAGFDTDEKDFFTSMGGSFGLIGGEVDLA